MNELVAHRLIRHLIPLDRMNVVALFAAANSALLFALSPDHGVFIGAPLLALAGFFVTVHRASVFHLTLPVNARTLALVRILWGIAVLMLPIGVWAVAARVRGTPGETLGSTILIVALVATLGVALAYAVQPRQRVGFTGPARFLYWSIVSVACAAILRWVPAGLAMVLLVSGTVPALWLVWQRIPAVFETARRGPVAATHDSGMDGAGMSGNRHWAWLVVRQSAPGLVLSASLMSVIFAVTGNTLYLLMAVMQSPYWMAHPRLAAFGTLPISHRARLLMLLVPNTMLPLLMIALVLNLPIPGLQFDRHMGWNAPQSYTSQERYYDSPTMVGVAYWKRVGHGPVPTVAAPWGETVQPFAIEAFGSTWYNPYSSRRTSSERFIDWQFTRATAAVYGEVIPRTQYPEFEDRHVLPKPRTRGLAMQLLNGGAILAGMLVIALCFVLGKRHRPHRSRQLHGVEATIPLFVTLPMMALYMMHMPQGGDVLGGIWLHQMLTLTDALAGNLAVVLLLAVLPNILLFAVIERQFKRAEAGVVQVSRVEA